MIKLKSLLESFNQWNDPWVHYSDVNYLKIRDSDSQSDVANDPYAIYLFPESHIEKMRYPYFKRMKYKMYVKLSPNLRVLDLSNLTNSIIQKFELTGKEISSPSVFWEILRRKFNNGKEFRKFLIEQGYDAVFDDIGAIYFSDEIQLGVFDPNNLEILKIVENKKVMP